MLRSGGVRGIPVGGTRKKVIGGGVKGKQGGGSKEKAKKWRNQEDSHPAHQFASAGPSRRDGRAANWCAG